VVADNQQLFAEGLAMILDAEDDFAVVGVAHDGRRAVELAADHRPAVLLLDAHLPDADLGATLTAVRVASPATKVLLLAGDARRETIAAVTACGADGLLAKDRSSRQVANAIRTVVNGQRAMMLATKPPRPSHDPNMELRIGTLSGREREILGLLASGWSNRRIAQERFLSLHTVRTHVQSILVKLGSTPSWRRSPSPTSTAWWPPAAPISGTATAPERTHWSLVPGCVAPLRRRPGPGGPAPPAAPAVGGRTATHQPAGASAVSPSPAPPAPAPESGHHLAAVAAPAEDGRAPLRSDGRP
jgi:DNA-binding NarL/FixJ family response regulator